MDNAQCPHARVQQSLSLLGNCFSSVKPFSHAQCRPLRQWTAQRRPIQALAKHQEHSQAQSSQQQHALIPSGLQPGLDRVHDTPAVVWFLVALQGVALVGALVGGVLARRRRFELIGLNTRLRQINSELRKRTAEEAPVCSVDEAEAAEAAYRQALEISMSGPSAAHPYELYGQGNLSLAQARQQLARLIREGWAALHDKNGVHAIETADEASNLAAELKDVRASRSVTRLKASALRQVGDLKGALRALEQAMALSEEIGDRSHDADVLGEIADTFADMGDFEQAAQNYDRCILAIQEEDGVPQPSAWDC